MFLSLFSDFIVNSFSAADKPLTEVKIMSAVIETPRPQTFNGPGPKVRLFTVKEYDFMIEQGILTTNDRVELLNGVIIEQMPKGPKHASLNDDIGDFFKEMLGAQVVVRNQNPVLLNEFSEPEPDIVLALPPRAKYRLQHPTADEILLVIEVSDTTLSLDRNAKAVAYAQAGIPQYLLFNVADHTIEDYRDPAPDGYRTKQTHTTGKSFNLVSFPELNINAADLLPPD
jgi:Uma2 family endonuclease